MIMQRLKNFFAKKKNPREGELIVRVYADQRMIIKTVGKATFFQKGDECLVTDFYSELKNKPRITETVEAERTTVSLVDFPDLEIELTYSGVFLVDPNLASISLTGKGNKNGAFITIK